MGTSGVFSQDNIITFFRVWKSKRGVIKIIWNEYLKVICKQKINETSQ